MRWIITISAFYILALSCLRCSDVNNQCEANIIKIETAQSHDHKRDRDDHCSPFCHCNCCGVSITSYGFKPLEIEQPKAFFTTRKITLHHYRIISNYSGSIWHPPKLTV